MTKNYEKLKKELDFNVILSEVASYAQTSFGKEGILEIVPDDEKSSIERALNKTEEAFKIVVHDDSLVFSGNLDIREYLSRVVKNGFLRVNELNDIKNFIVNGINVKKYFSNFKEYSYFNDLARKIGTYDEIMAEFDRCIDNNHKIKDNASLEIKKIRTSINSKENEMKNKINRIMSSNTNKLSEAIVTMRNGRYVLAVKSEYKNSFKGVIHDESATGQTVYIEPSEIFELGNTISQLLHKLDLEIEKILKYLSAFITNREEDFTNDFQIFKNIDILFAKARYCSKYDCVLPVIDDKQKIELLSARHPLIARQDVVANDIIFNEDVMLITGANTGGKTVTLKIIGLFSLMVKCGFMLPVKSARIPIFKEIFTDIGDNQSIENNLSSFSSHLTNLIDIIEHASDNTLVLFDEIGSGTNPTEGASIAYAIIEHLRNKGSKIVATTHYNELKEYSNANDYILSASVRFDVKSLKPTYKLDLGKSGLSYALSIAKSLGLADTIIENAHAFFEENSNQNLLLIDQLNSQKLELEEDYLRLSQLEKEINLQKSELASEKKLMREKLKIELNQARKAANEDINKMVLEAERHLHKLKSEDKMHLILEEKKKIEEKLAIEREKFFESDFDFKVGDVVKVLPYEQDAVILKIMPKNKFEVSMGQINSVVKKDKLLFVKRTKKSAVVSTQKVSKKVLPRLDIKGMRVEEAREKLEKYLDEILLTNYQKVVIEHGVGTGALRKLTLDILEQKKYNYRRGLLEEGGINVTVIEL